METKMTEGLPLNPETDSHSQTGCFLYLQSLQKAEECGICFAGLEYYYDDYQEYP